MENVVSRVEDHDAIIEASIRDCRQAAARIRIRLAKVKRDGEQLHKKKDKLSKDIMLWSDRAIEAASDEKACNQDRAIQCLKRKKLAAAELEKTEQTLCQHGLNEQKLVQNLSLVEKRIEEISQKRNTMRSRQSVSEAMKIINKLEGDSCFAIDDTFDRWETNLLEREIGFAEVGLESEIQVDEFEHAYIEQEEMELLKAELDQLTNKPSEQG